MQGYIPSRLNLNINNVTQVSNVNSPFLELGEINPCTCKGGEKGCECKKQK